MQVPECKPHVMLVQFTWAPRPVSDLSVVFLVTIFLDYSDNLAVRKVVFPLDSLLYLPILLAIFLHGYNLGLGCWTGLSCHLWSKNVMATSGVDTTRNDAVVVEFRFAKCDRVPRFNITTSFSRQLLRLLIRTFRAIFYATCYTFWLLKVCIQMPLFKSYFVDYVTLFFPS